MRKAVAFCNPTRYKGDINANGVTHMTQTKLTPAEISALADKFDAAGISASLFSAEAKAVAETT